MTNAPSAATCINDISRVILEKRYLIKNPDGSLAETPEDLFWRVALCVANIESRYGADDKAILEWANRFYLLMAGGYFEPNTPTLMNAGRNNGLGYAACYVLPISDSLVKGDDSIYQTLADMAHIHQGGGGTGFSFSNLRPEGSIVNSTSGVASGPVSFMQLYDASTEVVKQGGRRRGANMGILHCSHPDILKFINCKSDVTKITNFNISVAITDDFMNAVSNNDEYDLINPSTKEVVERINAREIFDAIVHKAHDTGEPGLFFIDKANKYNPVPHLGNYEATNPCGEQPLLPYDVCNLGSLNVGAYVNVPDDPQIETTFNWADFEKDIFTAIRFLDNIIDVNNYSLPQIKDLASKIRRIGLGVMGWADALIKLRIPYNSEHALIFAESLMIAVQNTAHKASQALAEEKGTFPEWEKSAWGPNESCTKINDERIFPMRKLRNCNVTTIAPTGTISIIAGCSSGIEPLFAVAFMRNQAGEKIPDVNQEFLRIAHQEGWYSKGLINRIADEGTIDFTEVPKKWRDVFITTQDVSPEHHVRMQATFQKHCDSAISKTINLPKSASIDDVYKAYLLAYELDCKGITVYRDGSRPDQILSTGKTESKIHKGKLRPEFVRGFTRKIPFAQLGKIYITINSNPETDEPVETFVQWGKAGSDEYSTMEALGRLISLGLKEGINPRQIIKQLKGIGGRTFVFHNGENFTSIPDAIAKTIEASLGYKTLEQEQLGMFEACCPDCGEPVQTAEGCNKCISCGYSAC